MFPGVEGLRRVEAGAGAAVVAPTVAAALDPRFVVQDGFIEENPFANSDDEIDDDLSGGKRKRRYTRRRQQNTRKTKKNKKMKKRKVKISKSKNK